MGTSGSGIDFSATSGTGTSELFDDYEEGTFTPTLVGLTTAGSGTYTSRTGIYTKVGNTVLYTVRLLWTAHTGTGSMDITGLPFTANSSHLFPASVYTGDVTLSANNLMIARVNNSSTSVALRQYPVGGGAISGITMDTAGEINISGHYQV
jgi:hypothetical protein